MHLVNEAASRLQSRFNLSDADTDILREILDSYLKLDYQSGFTEMMNQTDFYYIKQYISPRKFVYSKYPVEGIDSMCNSVTFSISRYGKVEETIVFNGPTKVRDAIYQVEEFLSRPLTEDYYRRIKDDLFDDSMPWEEASEYYSCRGECLTDAKHLERIRIDETGNLTFFIGS